MAKFFLPPLLRGLAVRRRILPRELLVEAQTAAAANGQVAAGSNNVQAPRDALRGGTQLESYLEIRAPFDGVVTQRNLHPGACAAHRANREPESFARGSFCAGSLRGRSSRRSADNFQRAGLSRSFLPRTHRAHPARHKSKHASGAGGTRFAQRGRRDHLQLLRKCGLAVSASLSNAVCSRFGRDHRPATHISDSRAPRKSRIS